MNGRFATIALLGGLGAGIGACAGPDAARSGEEGEPVYGGTLVIGGSGDLSHMNGLVNGDAATSEMLNFLLFTTLIRYGEDLNYEPYLAESWEMEGDTAVVFRLREDVFWHDGARTTAHDVAFTYRRIKDPATGFPNASWFEWWGDDADVLDDFTIRFTMEPHADPLVGWAETAIMPRHHLERVPADRLLQAEFNRNPVGNGPFRFASYRANDRWVFEANPDFPEALGGRPYVDRVVWRIIPENTTQVTALLTGQVHLITAPRAEQVLELKDRSGVRAIVRPSTNYHFIGWNALREPLGDPRVRRAFTMALNRPEALEALRGGFGELAVGPIGPFHWAYHDELDPLPHDPAGARALLEQAGFRDRNGDGYLQDAAGQTLTFSLMTVAGNEFQRDIAEKFRSDLAAAGVRMTVRATEWGTFVGDISSPERRFDAALVGWNSSFRIDLKDQFHTDALGAMFQMASYSNSEVDTIIDRATRITDQEIARPLWYRLQEIMREEQPWTFLYYIPDLFLASDRLRGAEMDIRGRYVTIARWWLAD